MNSACKISAEATVAAVTNHWRGKIKLLNFEMKSVLADAKGIVQTELMQKMRK